ncbi:(+)-gamma-cadinene synthase-like isoform X1 [Cucurbita moschata]|uniref:(+)-gamma-cadinene synthase-like isoform X1 n=1 Tax=Cucurbita moschata TaxID=3662 RepID=A0A6J1EN57_CUCMO|nr:(+)-gamma-cadinene synthase-like isoform X1 [Cucurbita moschata]
MSHQTSLVSVSTMKSPNTSKVERPLAKYHSSIWKDHFLSLSTEAMKIDVVMEERAKQLKAEVKKMLMISNRNLLEKLSLVDSIQRLSVFYHFENEIDQILEQIYANYRDFTSIDGDDDLHTISLLFRLLRQHGYRIPCDIFTKFVESNGKFKESLAEDARGILSLYEAANMRVHGEDILEEALDFSVKHLKNIMANSNSKFGAEIEHALKWPLRKDLPKLKGREYITMYQEDPSHSQTLLAFSKLDFNILQKLYQKELKELTRWWKDLNVETNFPYARDRIVECYFWTLGAYFEPQFNVGRKILTKVIAISSILDDTYDAYGTFEELQIFTEAIQRWDRSMVSILPEYMKPLYIAMLNHYKEISKEIGMDENSFHVHTTKEEIKKLARSYFEEAKWLNQNYTPKFKEYMEWALHSTGYFSIISVALIGMGDIVTNEILEWFFRKPKIINASTIICRLMDDIISRKFEQERKHVTSGVECYMEEYECSEEEVCVEFQKQVVDAWKDINEACLHPLDVPMPILMRIVNVSRVINLLYTDEDGYTNANGRTKFLIESLLVNPMPC